MTYFEWIKKIEELKTGPRNENTINELNNSKLNTSGNILNRFIEHINNLIKTRLINALDKAIKLINNTPDDLNELTLELINIKNEFNYCYKITKINIIPDENKKQFKDSLQELAEKINSKLEDTANNSNTSNELILLISNNKISIMEE